MVVVVVGGSMGSFRREVLVAGVLLSIASVGVLGCGPGEGSCEAVPSEPQCGETIEPVIVDRVGVSEAHAIALAGAKWRLDEALGDYVSGVARVYTGGARVVVDGEWSESFELIDEIGVVMPGSMAGSSFRFVSGDENGRYAITLSQSPDEDEVAARLDSTSTTGLCVANGLDLARAQDRIAATLTCERDDLPATADVVLEYERIAPEELSVDDALRAASISGAWPRWDDRLVPCGSGRVYDTDITFTDVSESGEGTTTWHVDTRTTWYVAEQCPQTHGATRIEILRVESCFCPTDGHCHGRADEYCVCLGDVAEDDPICAWP